MHLYRVRTGGPALPSQDALEETCVPRAQPCSGLRDLACDDGGEIVARADMGKIRQSDKLELSGSGGVHTLKFDASLSGNVTTPGGGTETRAASSSVTGPLPVIGFRLLWDMGHNFYLDGLAQFFYISFDNFDGSISDVKLTATWMPWRNFGVGLGYNNFRTRVDVGKNDFDGRLVFNYRGAMAFVTFAF